jgi:uncharacterized protein (DUF111 family)
MVEVATRFGIVRVKVASLNGRITNAKPEFDDCASLAAAAEAGQSLTLAEVQRAATTAFWAQHDA